MLKKIELENEIEKPCEYDAKLKVIRRDIGQIRTGAERVFLETLLHSLRVKGFTLDVGCQECVPIPLNRYCKLSVANQLEVTIQRYPDARYSMRRPDILLLKYGLVIEIDGDVHDKKNSCIRRDITREAEYAVLECQCLVINNRQIFDPEERRRVIHEIMEFIEVEQKQADFEKRYANRRAKISRARRAYQKLDSSYEIGGFRRKGQSRRQLYVATSCTQNWQGQRYKVQIKK